MGRDWQEGGSLLKLFFAFIGVTIIGLIAMTVGNVEYNYEIQEFVRGIVTYG